MGKAKSPCKRTQHCWPRTPNIVGPNNVVTCCVRLYGTTTMLALVAYSLKPVKLLGPYKRTQHCWPTTPNNVGSCWHLYTCQPSFDFRPSKPPKSGRPDFPEFQPVTILVFKIIFSMSFLCKPRTNLLYWCEPSAKSGVRVHTPP